MLINIHHLSGITLDLALAIVEKKIFVIQPIIDLTQAKTPMINKQGVYLEGSGWYSPQTNGDITLNLILKYNLSVEPIVTQHQGRLWIAYKDDKFLNIGVDNTPHLAVIRKVIAMNCEFSEIDIPDLYISVIKNISNKNVYFCKNTNTYVELKKD